MALLRILPSPSSVAGMTGWRYATRNVKGIDRRSWRVSLEDTSHIVVLSSHEVSALRREERSYLKDRYQAPLHTRSQYRLSACCLARITMGSLLTSCEIAIYLADIKKVHIGFLDSSVVRITLSSISSPVSYHQEHSLFLSVLRQIWPSQSPWILAPSR